MYGNKKKGIDQKKSIPYGDDYRYGIFVDHEHRRHCQYAADQKYQFGRLEGNDRRKYPANGGRKIQPCRFRTWNLRGLYQRICDFPA